MNGGQEKSERTKRHSLRIDDFLAGWIGGAAGVITSHPLDTVKVRLQTNTAYGHMVECIKRTVRKEGIKGFFKGMSFPLASVAVYNAFVFGVYSNTTRKICDYRYSDVNHSPRYSDLVLAAMLTGGLSAFVGSPVDLIKIQLQLQTESRIKNHALFHPRTSAIGIQPAIRQYSAGVRLKYDGPIQCLRHIYKHRGVTGLYRGVGAMVVRDVPGYVIYFLPYKIICDRFANEEGKTGSLGYLLAGGIAGVLSWGLMHPIDTVKSRLQADTGEKSKKKYRGTIHCMKTIYAEHGYHIFFRGLAANSVRGFIQSAALFLGYETAMSAFNGFHAT